MPFKSKAQQRLFFVKEKRGELPPGTAKRWAHETKSIKKLPEHVKKEKNMKKRAFSEALEKTAGFNFKPQTLDKAGLGLLAAAPAYHTYKAIKEKDKTQAALSGAEVGGLGLLYRAVQKSHK